MLSPGLHFWRANFRFLRRLFASVVFLNLPLVAHFLLLLFLLANQLPWLDRLPPRRDYFPVVYTNRFYGSTINKFDVFTWSVIQEPPIFHSVMILNLADLINLMQPLPRQHEAVIVSPLIAIEMLSEMVVTNKCEIAFTQAKPEIDTNGNTTTVEDPCDSIKGRARRQRRPTVITFGMTPANPGRAPGIIRTQSQP